MVIFNILRMIETELIKKKRTGVKIIIPTFGTQNPVIKGQQIRYMTRLGFMNDKFEWICIECGKIWFSQDEAEHCRQRNHRSKYTNKLAVMVNFSIGNQNFHGGMNNSYWNEVNSCIGVIKNLEDFFNF